MRKSNLRNKIKLYLKEKNKTSVEKEVFSLILSASQDYQELQTFFLKLYKEGINSGLIPKLALVKEKISFCDRFYFQIENFIKKSSEPIIFEKDSFIKVQMTNWVFFEILRIYIIPIMNVVDKTTHEIKQKVQYEPELYSVLDNFLPSDKFFQVYDNLYISLGVHYLCEKYPYFWDIVDNLYTIKSKYGEENLSFDTIRLHYNDELNTTSIIINKKICKEMLSHTIPLKELVFYYLDEQLLLESEY